MLIEFSVENFRSIRERQTLSMVAAPRIARKNNVFRPKASGEALPSLLKVAAIYGPNASGKTSILDALSFVCRLCARSPANSDRPLLAKPFRFDPQLADAPSYFELHFVVKGMRYEFHLGATAERITLESLTAYPKGEEMELYRRVASSPADLYSFHDELQGTKEVHDAWRKLTNQRTLFISQAVANSSEELDQLATPFSWLRYGLLPNTLRVGSTLEEVQRLALKHPIWCQELADFLSEFDIPITGIEAREVASEGAEKVEIENGPQDLEQQEPPPTKVVTRFTHKTALGSAKFSLSEESTGTRNLLAFALPWTLHQADRPDDERMRVMIVDELDSSLHPSIVQKLIRKMLASPIDGQLIFTTHDTHLMSTGLLRRDQFWITERDENGATRLRSVYEFEGREGEQVERRYFAGRYSGLPVLKGS